ncbi:MAG TPA: RagB/SusD family nutrient uptake outer membrane protein [Cyclobacteriaceae bacterium]|nr:RagB/SusD family nutrient uptake outer membrane protein [Cyclobacteriaceae bacterium]
MEKIYKIRLRNSVVNYIPVFLLLFACEDFLEKPPQGQLTQAAFPVTAADALAATNAAYYTLRDGNYHFGLFPLTDIMSDDARKGSNPGDQESTIGSYDKFQHINTETSLERWWATLYQGIRRANVVIVKVQEIDMNEDLKQQYIGEAKFLRALMYFDLVRAWGGVPLVTDLNPPLDLARNSEDEIYSIIEQDLLDAIAGLPEKSEEKLSDYGRATRGAAKALLARVYLFLGDFTNVEKYTLEMINSGEYSLEPDFVDANSVLGEQGVESVFEVGALGDKEGIENGGAFYANVQGVRGTPNRGWGFNRPSMDLLRSFEPGDPRKDKTVIFLGEVIDGVTILGDGLTPDVTLSGSDTLEIECYNQKTWTPGAIVAPTQGHNRRIIRYADVLLMAAEALNENGKSAQALTYLNQVRARARGGNNTLLPDITETNKDALRDLILKERRAELALEGLRFWDLVRTGKAETVLGPLGFVKGKHELFAVPQKEIDISQGRLTQNPNWE